MKKLETNNKEKVWVVGKSLLTIEKKKKEDINKYKIFNIIKNNRLAMTRGLTKAHIAWNYRAKNRIFKMRSDIFSYL